MLDLFKNSIDNFLHSPRIISIFLCIFGVIALARILVWYFEWRKQHHDVSSLSARISSWWKIYGIIFIALAFGKLGACILFSIVSIFGFREYIKAVGLDDLKKYDFAIAFLFIPLQYLVIYLKDYDSFLISIPLLAQIILAFVFIFTQRVHHFVKNIGLLNWGLLLTTFCLSHLVYFMNLDDPRTFEVEPLGLITYVLIITQTNDVAQYLFGKMLGRHKILPKVSPNKTIEGLLGGLFFSAILAYYLGPYITHLTPLEAVGAGLLLSFFGFFGDVFMSAIKRDRHIKDFSSFIPGHGGILDRVDSLIIAAPLFFHYYRLFFPEFY
jgi:phosphatidate cytidylyltransferase